MLCSLAQLSEAQGKKNLLGFNVGGEFIPSNSLAAVPDTASREIKTSNSLALALYYGRQIHNFDRAELWLDVPALVGPNHKITGGSPLLPTSAATFYVTPSARIAFPTQHPWTPWLSIGGGYGLFETSDFLAGGANNPRIHTHTGVLQFGGGVDVKTPLKLFVPVGFRAEFRDFYTLKAPVFFTPVTGQSQHNLSASAGVNIRF